MYELNFRFAFGEEQFIRFDCESHQKVYFRNTKPIYKKWMLMCLRLIQEMGEKSANFPYEWRKQRNYIVILQVLDDSLQNMMMDKAWLMRWSADLLILCCRKQFSYLFAMLFNSLISLANASTLWQWKYLSPRIFVHWKNYSSEIYILQIPFSIFQPEEEEKTRLMSLVN